MSKRERRSILMTDRTAFRVKRKVTSNSRLTIKCPVSTHHDLSLRIEQINREHGGKRDHATFGGACVKIVRKGASQRTGGLSAPRLGYSSYDCIPAEPNSASPDKIIVQSEEMTCHHLIPSEVDIKGSITVSRSNWAAGRKHWQRLHLRGR